MSKHVKILENALRRERDKAKKLATGEQPDDKQSEKGSNKDSSEPGRNSPLTNPAKSNHDNEDTHSTHNEIKQNNERDKSRLYLGKCVQEVTYHVIPTTVAQQALAEEQEQLLQNHQYQDQSSQQPMGDIYPQQQRMKQITNHTGDRNL